MPILRTAFLIALLGSAVFFQGCARYRVAVSEPTPATDYETATLNAYFWGAIEENQHTENCKRAAIDEVRIHQTFPNILATVLTLGIWMPLEVEWKCAKPKQSEGPGL